LGCILQIFAKDTVFRASLITLIEMMPQRLFLDMRSKKWSLAELNEYGDRSLRMPFISQIKNLSGIYGCFGNEVTEKKSKSSAQTGFLRDAL